MSNRLTKGKQWFKQHPKSRILIVLCFSIFLAGLLFHFFVMPKQLFSDPTSTILLDEKGNLLSAHIADDGQWRFPETDSLNQQFVTCLIQYEDQRFYQHLGIDLVAIVRALKHNIQARTIKEGGSTLTMQLARMARGNQPRTLLNKVIEALWAIDIEMTYSKEEILRLYVSHAPFGGNVVGIDAAAWRYFNRSLDLLSWSEMCTLAVLPNSPALIHLGRNRSALKEKRDKLLTSLKDDHIISNDQFLLSLEETIPDQPYSLPNKAPHYLDYLAKTNKGKIIRTSIRPQLQTMVQQLANDYCDNYRNSNHIDNIAVLILDVQSGKPITYIGNTTHTQSEAWQVDIIQSERSPGSTLKPFLYAAMLSSGEITPRQLISDTPLNINGFSPSNFNHTFSGAVHADEAIIQSLNIPLVRMVSQHTPGRFMEDLKWAGMTTLHYNEDHYGVSIILGGAEIKLWDLCQMYRKLSYQLQSPIADNPSNRITKPAIWYTFQAMSKLNRPEEEAEWIHFRSMKSIAWKTGTSWGSRDAWSVGVTPKYVVGVWTGNATGEGRAGMTGVGFSSPIMFDIFALLENVKWFDMPYKELEPMKVCRQSGCLATSICATTDTVYLPKASSQTDFCKYCHWVHLSTDKKWQVNASCVNPNKLITQAWFTLPPAQEYYYKQHHVDYYPLPPYREDCVDNSLDQLDFIYPDHQSTIFIPRGFNGQLEHVVFKAVCRREQATLFWHLDNEYLGETHQDHQISLIPEKGDHILSIVDEVGNRRAIEIHIQ